MFILQSMTESDGVPMDFTLELVETMDAIRGKVGLNYGTGLT